MDKAIAGGHGGFENHHGMSKIAKSVIETADKEVKHKTKQTNRKEFIGSCAAETKQAER